MTLQTLATRIVVAGTGTNVGKTFGSCQLLELLRTRALQPQGLKPVETGYRQEASDAAALAAAAGHGFIPPLFTAPDPVSPHRAARALGYDLTSAQIADWVNAANRGLRPTLVETAGGLFSPLSETETMLDIVRALEPCFFLLIAADRLGTLHDVTSTLIAARGEHRLPDAILLSPLEPNDLENAAELTRLNVGPPVFSLASQTDLSVLCDTITRVTVHL